MYTLPTPQRAEDLGAELSHEVTESELPAEDDEVQLQNDSDAPDDIEFFKQHYSQTSGTVFDPDHHIVYTTPDPERSPVGEFDDLESLLTESVKLQSEAQKYKDQRRTLSKSWLTAEERKAIEASVRSYELRREWFPQANTAMFTVQRCSSCSSLHHHFVGFFQRQEHRSKLASRWVKADMSLIDSLPRERKENVEEVSTCITCCLNSLWGSAS